MFSASLYLVNEKTFLVAKSKGVIEIWDLNSQNLKMRNKPKAILNENPSSQIKQLKLLKNDEIHSKIISIGENLKIWNISLEVCCFNI